MSIATPIKIAVNDGGKSLVLTYNTPPKFELSAEYLRVHSPSAEVQGHGAEGGVLPVGKSTVTISNVEKSGHYAIKLIFSDGHDSGIYTWAYLYELAMDQPARWEQYLHELRLQGGSRHPEEQVVRLIDPSNS